MITALKLSAHCLLSIFPPMIAMQPKIGHWVQLLSRVKWALGKPWRSALHEVLSNDGQLASIVEARPILLRPLFRVYLDRRTFLWARQIHFANDFHSVSQRLCPKAKAALAAHGLITLVELPEGFSICFGINEIMPEEGVWALSLRDAEGRRVFHLTFGILPDDRIVVGSVQGGRQEADFEPGAVIRSFTKLCHGLRPHMFLAEILVCLSRAWACNSVEFVPLCYQARSRWNRPPRNIQFDYRAYFLECGMTQQDNALWRLPDQLPHKSLDEVESRKRSMYRKRYALLDAALQQCKSNLKIRRT